MRFSLKEQRHPNSAKYASSDADLAHKFASAMQQELGAFLKAAILFGSTARDEKPLYDARDIDVLIIIDDLTHMLSSEVVQSYRVITENCAARISKRLHITTLKLTTFWEYVRAGDPIAINMLRDGVPLYDAGFFAPAQHLLFQGRIRPTRESIWTYFARAPATLVNADWHILQATLDLYWAVVDSAHAALMQHGEIPPTPAHLADLLNKKFCREGKLPKRYADLMHQFFTLQKQIVHRELQKVSGREFDAYKKDAEDFVKTMQTIVEKK